MKNYMDFMLVLSPSAKVKAIVHEHKQHAASIIGDYESVKSIAHISIKRLSRQKTFLTEPDKAILSKNLALIPPVTLTIGDFDYFNHGQEFKTIYARIRSTPSTSLWFKELKRHLNFKEFLVPHITITRNISVAQFNQLWPHFNAVKWEESFTVNTLTVLQKETFASFAKWEVYTELSFGGKPPHASAPPKHPPLKSSKQGSAQSQQTSLF
jgi:2'-5' RNA ligase